MPSYTTKLHLVLPENGEFTDRWNEPVNLNMESIDTFLGNLKDEVEAARGNQTDLVSRIETVVDPDGIPITPPEVIKARNSQVYGNDNGSINYTLKERLDLGDREVFNARETRTTLRDNLAVRAKEFTYNSIVKAPTGFLSYTGAELKLDGSASEILFNIEGYLARAAKLISRTVTGAGTTYYAYVQAATETIVDGDSSTAPPSSASGNIRDNGSGKFNRFRDTTENYTTKNVAAGMILEITDGAFAGEYIVGSVISSIEVEIIGIFDTTSPITNLNYIITDPYSVTLNYEATKTPAEGKLFVGEFVFDGAQITSVTKYALKGEYKGFTAVSAAPTFESVIEHNLGELPSEVFVYGSQTNDGSQPLEPLSVAGIASTLAVSGDATVVAPTSFYGASVSSGDTTQPVTVTPGANASLTGAVSMKRSVAVQITNKKIYIKNVLSGHFYTDYAGVDKAGGYLYVVVKR